MNEFERDIPDGSEMNHIFGTVPNFMRAHNDSPKERLVSKIEEALAGAEFSDDKVQEYLKSLRLI